MGLMRDGWIRGSLIARFREDFVEGLIWYTSGIADDSSGERTLYYRRTPRHYTEDVFTIIERRLQKCTEL